MKLIVLDMDGTVLNSKKEISEENIFAIKKAQEKGHIVMMLSGRAIESVKEKLSRYNLSCPVGGDNGSVLYANGRVVESTSLNSTQNQLIGLALGKEEVPYKISTNKGTFAPKEWDERLENVLSSGLVPEEYFTNPHFNMFTRSPKILGQKYFHKVEEVIDNEDILIQKYLILGFEPKNKERLQLHLQSIKDTNVTSSSPFNIEVTHINGNKGYGLSAMASYFNIPLKDTVAIGDERNDIPMFNVAGFSIAMGNAEDEVKSKSDVITLSNDENGVAHAFEQYIL